MSFKRPVSIARERIAQAPWDEGIGRAQYNNNPAAIYANHGFIHSLPAMYTASFSIALGELAVKIALEIVRKCGTALPVGLETLFKAGHPATPCKKKS